MARAYIVLARHDIEDNMLQVLDLQPNSSQPGIHDSYLGQTGYVAFAAQHDTVAFTQTGGMDAMTADYTGLAAYICDNVQDAALSRVMSVALANAAATDILNAVVAGTAVTKAALDPIVALGAAGSVVTLAQAHDILRILAGEVYLVPAATAMAGAGDGGHAWAGTPVGSFVARTSTEFRDVRAFIDTSSLHLSRYAGALSKFCASTFLWNNPAKTYVGTGLFVDETTIPATHLGRALVVYDTLGTPITT
jgi:hypothetical protein